MDYTISVTQNKIRRLPKPYSSKCVDYQKIGFKDTFYGFLNLDVSLLQHINHVMSLRKELMFDYYGIRLF